jgi:hypothetical protein
VLGIEARVELAAFLGRAGEGLEARERLLDACPGRGVKLRVALLLADQVRKEARAFRDGAERQCLVALDDLGERFGRPAQPALGERLAEEQRRLGGEAHHRADDGGDQLVLAREVAVTAPELRTGSENMSCIVVR